MLLYNRKLKTVKYITLYCNVHFYPQGLEVPEDSAMGLRINRAWTVRAKGMVNMGDEGDGGPGVPGAHDYDEGWGVDLVPEMRDESAVVANPLYRQGSFMTKAHKVMPQEFIENTKL